jgi:GPH family glycoside/pentoside/hexuronide:cation symporter
VAQELGWGRIGVYAVPAVGATAPIFFVQFYFLSFATDALLLAPATVGLILASGRIWDAVTDPMAGYGSDRTRSRWGRRRPWMFIAGPATAAAFVALWNPPEWLVTPTGLATWSAFWLFALTTAVTAWGVPHQALGAELSTDANARHRIFGVRFVVAITGAALSFGGMQLVGNAEDPRAMASQLGWVVGAGMAVLLVAPSLLIRERPSETAVVSAPPLRAALDVIADRDARRLLGVWFIAQLGMASQGVIAPYMAIYVLQRPDLIGVMPALFIGPMVLSVPAWIALARRFGAQRVWRLSMFGGAIAYTGLFWLPADDFVWIAILLGSAGFSSGCGGPIGPSFFAATADASALKTGERREGVYFAAKEFVEKASGAAVALAVGVLLQVSGFEPNVEQGPTTIFTIRGCLSFLPGLSFLLGAVLLSRLGAESPRVAVAEGPVPNPSRL